MINNATGGLFMSMPTGFTSLPTVNNFSTTNITNTTSTNLCHYPNPNRFFTNTKYSNNRRITYTQSPNFRPVRNLQPNATMVD